MDINKLFNETQIGLLEEALNIGTGNAVTALSQILQCDTDMSLPVLESFSSPIPAEIYQDFGANSLSVEMNIVGEIQGGLIVVIPETEIVKITNLIRSAREEQKGEGVPDISIITEASNIMAGSFLTAIHDFCGLNIFHTVPAVEQHSYPQFAEIIKKQALNEANVFLVIKQDLIVNKHNIKAFLLMVLADDSSTKLVQALESIRVV